MQHVILNRQRTDRTIANLDYDHCLLALLCQLLRYPYSVTSRCEPIGDIHSAFDVTTVAPIHLPTHRSPIVAPCPLAPSWTSVPEGKQTWRLKHPTQQTCEHLDI